MEGPKGHTRTLCLMTRMGLKGAVVEKSQDKSAVHPCPVSPSTGDLLGGRDANTGRLASKAVIVTHKPRARARGTRKHRRAWPSELAPSANTGIC